MSVSLSFILIKGTSKNLFLSILIFTQNRSPLKTLAKIAANITQKNQIKISVFAGGVRQNFLFIKGTRIKSCPEFH
jgi:hypothetical protein